MNTSVKLILAGAGILTGALVYDHYRRNKPAQAEPEIKKHKNRHLSPVFSKVKEMRNT